MILNSAQHMAALVRSQELRRMLREHEQQCKKDVPAVIHPAIADAYSKRLRKEIEELRLQMQEYEFSAFG